MLGIHRRRLAPRPVSLAAAVQGLLGGIAVQVGWWFLAMGMLASTVFAADSELVTMGRFRGAMSKVDGEVIAVKQTASEENEDPVMAVRFRYQVDGTTHDGTSYMLTAPFDPGDQVASTPTVGIVRDEDGR